MKAFIVCLAIASAVADPQLLTTYNAINPWGAPVAYSNVVPTVYNTVPSVYNAVPFPYALNANPLVAKVGEKVEDADKTVSDHASIFTPAYAGKGVYRAENDGAVHVAKREAEAEADPYLVYSSALAPTYYNAWAQRPVVAASPFYSAVWPTTVKSYANDAARVTPNYAGKGQYVAENAGAIHIAKREAEADPLTIYRTAGYPLTYSNVYSPYVASTYNNIYNPLGYRYLY